MKPIRKAYLIGSVLTIVALTGGLVSALYAGVERVPLRKYIEPAAMNSVWDWSNAAQKSAKDLNDTSLFLYQHQVNTVFLDVSGVLEDNRQPQLETAFSDYIRAMQERKIVVYAAAGHTDWSKPDERWQPEKIMDFVYGYNQRHPQESFAGIELDIEAYNQAGFAEGSMDEKGQVLLDYMDMVDVLATKHTQANSSLPLGFAVPYWFDNENKNIESINWNGKIGPILYHLADRLNQLPQSNLVVMAYRNAARGTDGTISHARTEVDYTRYKAPNVKILVGQEVSEVEPAKITFHGLSLAEFSREAKLIAEEFGPSGTYGGIAINDLQSFQNF
jgi:hypothetical protein